MPGFRIVSGKFQRETAKRSAGVGFLRGGRKSPGVSAALLMYLAFWGTLSSRALSNVEVQQPQLTDVLPSECGRRQMPQVSERIINGRETTYGSWPWIVELRTISPNQHICGGALISDRYLLTTAHCFGNTSERNVVVHLGIHNITQPDHSEVAVGIEHVCIHPNYNCTDPRTGDIAVVKLNFTVNFTTFIQPICLPGNCAEIPANTIVYTAGWGTIIEYATYEGLDYGSGNEGSDSRTSSHGENSDGEMEAALNPSARSDKEVLSLVGYDVPEVLHETNLSILTHEQCEAGFNYTVPQYLLCHNESHGSGCYGDSGGPVIHSVNGTWILDGVLASGPEDCLGGEPGTSVKVSYFLDSFIFPYLTAQTKNVSNYRDICLPVSAIRDCGAHLT